MLGRKGLEVSFGSIDDFFVELGKRDDLDQGALEKSDDLFGPVPQLNPAINSADVLIRMAANAGRMYQGWPATLADIDKGLTFQRDKSQSGAALIASGEKQLVTYLGASGTGKTTAARQALLHLMHEGLMAWEHIPERELLVKEWRELAQRLENEGKFGVLFIDDAHDHLRQINQLIDRLVADQNSSLKFILASARHDWNPRVKSPNLYRVGKEIHLKSLSDNEISNLISLVENQSDIRQLVSSSFGNFSRGEKRRRLRTTCSANTFVCLKNIFDSDSFDDIILKEGAYLRV